jgi:NAD+ synthase
MITRQNLIVDAPKVTLQVTDFIKSQIEKSGLKGAIVSLSGGIDSSLVLALTVEALGPERVTGVTMLERDVTPESDITDVMRLCATYDVTCDTVEITPILRVMRDALPLHNPEDRVTLGNLKARTRMLVAYHYANSLSRMVMGSSNKTELLTGYFTKYGDGGVDLMPIAGLYKTQVRQLARHLRLPESIISKPPSGGLWPGQTDEGELGITYELLDQVLYGMERGMKASGIARDLQVEVGLVEMVLNRVRSTEHKRRLPLILRLS